MFSFSSGENNYPYLFLNNYVITTFWVGIVFAAPLRKYVVCKMKLLVENQMIFSTIKYIFFLGIFLFSLMELAQTTYNPFIYFRF